MASDCTAAITLSNASHEAAAEDSPAQPVEQQAGSEVAPATGDSPSQHEPTVISSNRYNDVEPYMGVIYGAEPEKWGAVMPWDFPCNGSKEDEAAFLRTYFTDREIRMQGGAEGSGEGFRFLKQVWVSISLWNAQFRVPAIARDWLEKEANKELVKSKEMREHLLREDAKETTVFDDKDFKLYGSKILFHAFKYIQQLVREMGSDAAVILPEATSSVADMTHLIQANAAAEGVDVSSSDNEQARVSHDDRAVTTTTDGNVQSEAAPPPTASVVCKDGSSIEASSTDPEKQRETPIVHTASHSANTRDVPTMSLPAQEAFPMYLETASPAARSRGHFANNIQHPRHQDRGVRGSFGNRQPHSHDSSWFGVQQESLIPAPGFEHAVPAQGHPSHHFNALPASVHPSHQIMQGMHLVHHTPPPSTDQLMHMQGWSPHPQVPPVQWGLQYPNIQGPPQRGFQNQRSHHNGARNVHVTFGAQHMFVDRTNEQSNFQSHAAHQPRFEHDNESYRYRGRRATHSSRPDVGRGTIGRGKQSGRMSRGRGANNMDIAVGPFQNDFYQKASNAPETAQVHNSERRGSILQEPSWRPPPRHDENAHPSRHTSSNHVEDGANIKGFHSEAGAKRALHSMPHQHRKFSEISAKLDIAYLEQMKLHVETRSPLPNEMSCSENSIGDHCRHAVKLILFQRPHGVTDKMLEDFFHRVTPRVTVSTVKKDPHIFSFAVFEDHYAARAALDLNGHVLLGSPVTVQVSKEHWDMSHRDYPGSNVIRDWLEIGYIPPNQVLSSAQLYRHLSNAPPTRIWHPKEDIVHNMTTTDRSERLEVTEPSLSEIATSTANTSKSTAKKKNNSRRLAKTMVHGDEESVTIPKEPVVEDQETCVSNKDYANPCKDQAVTSQHSVEGGSQVPHTRQDSFTEAPSRDVDEITKTPEHSPSIAESDSRTPALPDPVADQSQTADIVESTPQQNRPHAMSVSLPDVPPNTVEFKPQTEDRPVSPQTLDEDIMEAKLSKYKQIVSPDLPPVSEAVEHPVADMSEHTIATSKPTSPTGMPKKAPIPHVRLPSIPKSSRSLSQPQDTIGARNATTDNSVPDSAVIETVPAMMSSPVHNSAKSLVESNERSQVDMVLDEESEQTTLETKLRKVSGGSDAATFHTAPSTPAVAQQSQPSSDTVDNVPTARSANVSVNNPPKMKGPKITESLSIFSKSQKSKTKKKSKSASLKGKPKSADTSGLEMPEELPKPMAKSPARDAEQSSELESLSLAPSQSKVPGEAVVTQHNRKDEPQVKSPSRKPGMLARLGEIKFGELFRKKSPAVSPTQSSFDQNLPKSSDAQVVPVANVDTKSADQDLPSTASLDTPCPPATIDAQPTSQNQNPQSSLVPAASEDAHVRASNALGIFTTETSVDDLDDAGTTKGKKKKPKKKKKMVTSLVVDDVQSPVSADDSLNVQTTPSTDATLDYDFEDGHIRTSHMQAPSSDGGRAKPPVLRSKTSAPTTIYFLDQQQLKVLQPSPPHALSDSKTTDVNRTVQTFSANETTRGLDIAESQRKLALLHEQEACFKDKRVEDESQRLDNLVKEQMDGGHAKGKEHKHMFTFQAGGGGGSPRKHKAQQALGLNRNHEADTDKKTEAFVPPHLRLSQQVHHTTSSFSEFSIDTELAAEGVADGACISFDSRAEATRAKTRWEMDGNSAYWVHGGGITQVQQDGNKFAIAFEPADRAFKCRYLLVRALRAPPPAALMALTAQAESLLAPLDEEDGSATLFDAEKSAREALGVFVLSKEFKDIGGGRCVVAGPFGTSASWQVSFKPKNGNAERLLLAKLP